MELTCSNPEPLRLTLPASVFVEAVRMAAKPRCPIESQVLQKGVRHAVAESQYAAVDLLTTWWNETAPPELRGAFSFMPYVKVHDGWASGDIEEGYVGEEAMLRMRCTRAVATLQDTVMVWFYRTPTMNMHRWFYAPSVDGSHSAEGGLPAWISAEQMLATDAYDALHEFPFRFGGIWADLIRNPN
ncbi:hypothetical protein [Burkholderia ambifaria]|uniref:hypothetical protein n=1 Tax=Burkholderia ambifaria TaxID=152480 RepID=UPI002FE3B68F